MNLAQRYKALKLLTPQVVLTTQTPTAVPVAEYLDDAAVILDIGACSGADSACDVIIRTSIDGGSNYTTVVTFAQLTPTSDNKIALGKVNLFKVTHIKAVATITDSSDQILDPASYEIGVSLLALSEDQSASLNSTTPA